MTTRRSHWHRILGLATAIGALMGAQVVKSVGTAAVDGEGLKKGVQNLVSPSTPGDGKP